MERVARSLAAPAVVAGVGLAAAGLLRFRDPHSALYVQCPFHALTGWWCPACGGLRAVNDLMHGDVVGSLSSNIWVVPLLALWVVWAVSRWTGAPVRVPVGRTAGFAILAVLVGYTVLRNVPAGAWLAP